MSGLFNKLATPFVTADTSPVSQGGVGGGGQGTVPIKRAD